MNNRRGVWFCTKTWSNQSQIRHSRDFPYFDEIRKSLEIEADLLEGRRLWNVCWGIKQQKCCYSTKRYDFIKMGTHGQTNIVNRYNALELLLSKRGRFFGAPCILRFICWRIYSIFLLKSDEQFNIARNRKIGLVQIKFHFSSRVKVFT